MGKNANGAGTPPKKMKNRDLYRARYTDSNGKQKSVYGKTYEDCRKKWIEALSNRSKGLNFDSGNMSVGEYLNRWLTDSVLDTVKVRTYEEYESIVRCHLVPTIGKTKLGKLTPSHVRALYRSKLDAGLSPRRVQYVHITLRKALTQAVLDGLLPRNVTDAVTAPKPASKEMRVLDGNNEVRAFLEATKPERLHALFILAISTGMRMGELSGLTWRSVDFESGKVSISRSLAYSKKDGPFFTDTKNKSSRRRIKISQRTLNALLSHRKRQAEERLRAGSEWQDNGLVFPGEHGQPLRPWVITRALQRSLKRAGLPQSITFHEATRHTCATLLLGKGVHPKLVQELLGHSQISITLDTYSHVLPGMDDGLSDTIDEAIS